MALDNSSIIAHFMPYQDDGDTFLYTEMLDRGKAKGNNGHRLLKTFYHRSLEEFTNQLPVIKALCDLSCVRACTRLAPRSWKRVGKEHVRLVIETALTENWLGMKSLYNRALGISRPIQKYWLWDIDEVNSKTAELAQVLSRTYNDNDDMPVLRATIPSKKGLHYITIPFNAIAIQEIYPEIQVHKDNPTNLYIPDGAM